MICHGGIITKKSQYHAGFMIPDHRGSLEMVTICDTECYLTQISVVCRSYLARYFSIMSVWYLVFKIGVMLQSLIEYFKTNVSILYDHIPSDTDDICGSRVGQGVRIHPPEKSQNYRVS